MSANEFEKGDLVTISSGCHAGKKGTIVRDVYPNGTLAVKIDGVKNSFGYMPGELEAAPWGPKPGDRVKSGDHFIGLIGTVTSTGLGSEGDIAVVELAGLPHPFREGRVAMENLEPAEKPHISDVVGVTIKRTDVPPRYQWTAQMDDRVRHHVPRQERAKLSDDEVLDLIRKAVGDPDSNPRKDGHSTGPILTGDARESYLALQSGAEDPHAKPEPLTEPSCGYCKDTGIGVMGMECPVRTCEAVST